MDSVKCFNLKQGLNLYYIPVNKFKTTYVSINIHNELKEETASKCALLADVMRRGSRKFPDEPSMSAYLQGLFGASFSTDIKRKGIDQILTFAVTAVDDAYLPEGEACFDKVLEFLFDMLLDPYLENGAFCPTYVSQEKANLMNDINALVNEKRAYSVWRLIENMCEGDVYSVHELGSAEKVENIDAEELYAFYQNLLKTGPIDIFVTGNADVSKICVYAQKRFEAVQFANFTYPVPDLYHKNLGGKEVTERFDVTQSKLCLGYKTSVSPTSKDYYKLMVYNGILGGGAHCKLFNEVREKLSLAYYAGSRLERFKGLMILSAGIESGNKQQALDEIFAQVDLMKQGKFTETEFDAAVKSIVNSLRTIGDSIAYLCDYYLGQTITNTQISLEEYIAEIEKVTPEDVVAVAQNISLEMVYFLTGKESEEK